MGRNNVRRCTGSFKSYLHDLDDVTLADCVQILDTEHCFIIGKLPASDNLFKLHIRARQLDQARAQIWRRPLLALSRSTGGVWMKLCGIEKRNPNNFGSDSVLLHLQHLLRQLQYAIGSSAEASLAPLIFGACRYLCLW